MVILIIIALICVVLSLMIGVIGMAKGGEKSLAWRHINAPVIAKYPDLPAPREPSAGPSCGEFGSVPHTYT